MYVNGKWYSEAEIEAYVNKLKGQIAQRDKFIRCVRSYYRESISWIDLFEEDYGKLATDSSVGGKNGGVKNES